jgi:broad specificity phosphatase PhoE
MVTRLYLVRHGTTADAQEKRYKGSIDVPLSGQGEEQARLTGRMIREIMAKEGKANHPAGSVALYASSLRRACQTAALIGDFLGVSAQVVSDLQERHFGQWEGLTFDEVRTRFPEDFARWMADPLAFSPSGGENTLSVKRRALKAVKRILKENRERQVCIVAHGGVNRVLLCHFLGMPLRNLFRLEQDFTAVNIIDFYDDFPVVKAVNLTAREVYG